MTWGVLWDSGASAVYSFAFERARLYLCTCSPVLPSPAMSHSCSQSEQPDTTLVRVRTCQARRHISGPRWCCSCYGAGSCSTSCVLYPGLVLTLHPVGASRFFSPRVGGGGRVWGSCHMTWVSVKWSQTWRLAPVRPLFVFTHTITSTVPIRLYAETQLSRNHPDCWCYA